MKNLTTRKIVLGMLMTLVLAFSVQGIADALNSTNETISLDTTTSGNATADLDYLSIDRAIVLDIGGFTLDNTDARESISVSISAVRGGASFRDPDSSTAGSTTTSQTWTETDTLDPTDENDTIDHRDGALVPALEDVEINVHKAGIVRVTVSWTSSDAPEDTSATVRTSRRNKSQIFTFYVVKDPFDVSHTDTISLTNQKNGIGAGNVNRRPVKIHTGDGKNNLVTYTLITAGGALYVRDGNRPEIQPTAPVNSLTTSSSADVWLAMLDDSRTVKVQINNREAVDQATYIYGIPRLVITAPTTQNPLEGDPGEVEAPNAITVAVRDQEADGSYGTGNVPHVLVKFDVADKSATGGYLIPPDSADTIPTNGDSFSDNITDMSGSLIKHSTLSNLLPTRTLYMRTGENNAAVGFEFGSVPGTAEIRVSIAGQGFNTITEMAEATVTGVTTTQLSISSNTRRSGNSKLFDLIAYVEKDGKPARGVTVTFQTRFGELTSTPTGETIEAADAADGAEVTDFGDGTDAASTAAMEGRQVTDITGRSGLAQVIYDLGNNTGRQEIDASIYDADPDSRQEVTFVVNGPADSGRDQRDDSDRQSDTPTRILDIDVSGSGNTRDVTVTALQNGVPQSGISVDLTVSGAATLSRTSGGTPLESELTLPGTAGTYTLRASTTATGYSAVTEDVEVTLPGTLTISPLVDTTAAQLVTVTARRNGSLQSGVNFTISGSGIVPARGVTTASGSGNANLILSRLGTYSLTVSADEYTDLPVSITITNTGQPATTPTTTGPAGEADSIEIDGQRQRSAAVNQATPLRVRVTDANGTGVRDVKVTFKVLQPGKGRLSQRGNGRAVQDQTDRNGYASASLTPLGGNLIVEAKAAGVSAAVTFIINVGEASDDPETPAPGPSDTPPRTEINPAEAEVHIGAANRPPMLWIDGGAIYALVGANVQRFAPSVDNALNIAIGGGKVYWTEQTGESSGTINSANPDGSGMKELKAIMAVPMGIAVDVDAEKVYWTNSRGRIQRLNADGSGGVENVSQNLPSPMDIAIARGNVYWTQYDATASAGNVGIVNPTAARTTPRYISTGSDMPGSLVIGGNKVYWTEQTGTNAGTINSANLNGNGATELRSILAVPMGIAVDVDAEKVYWTNSRGRIQRLNADGSGRVENVVDGLGMPGDMVLSNSIAAPAATTPTTPTTASKSQYDVNGDGSVDSKDVTALIDAISLGVTADKYDVNGDGEVNILDARAVNANLDEGAASAPSRLGMKLTTVQIDRLQEQINLLIATGDRSPAAIKTLIYLQQLIATARPEQTQLLANYPNPFNPETWIPYELATDTNVRITIYNTHGVVIRTLALGHQSAGYYTGRDRAAYWDGRNAFGEQVASGIYFYQFETDDISSMRKMVILK